MYDPLVMGLKDPQTFHLGSARPVTGSVLGSPWEGRTFSISLRSPDVAGAPGAPGPGSRGRGSQLGAQWKSWVCLGIVMGYLWTSKWPFIVDSPIHNG